MAANRRSFLKRALGVALGGIFGLSGLPKLVQAESLPSSTLGQKQLHLLMAGRGLLQKTGMLRADFVFYYANDGEVQMDWTVFIPPEDKISPETDSLAQQIIALINQ